MESADIIINRLELWEENNLDLSKECKLVFNDIIEQLKKSIEYTLTESEKKIDNKQSQILGCNEIISKQKYSIAELQSKCSELEIENNKLRHFRELAHEIDDKLQTSEKQNLELVAMVKEIKTMAEEGLRLHLCIDCDEKDENVCNVLSCKYVWEYIEKIRRISGPTCLSRYVEKSVKPLVDLVESIKLELASWDKSKQNPLISGSWVGSPSFEECQLLKRISNIDAVIAQFTKSEGKLHGHDQ